MSVQQSHGVGLRTAGSVGGLKLALQRARRARRCGGCWAMQVLAAQGTSRVGLQRWERKSGKDGRMKAELV